MTQLSAFDFGAHVGRELALCSGEKTAGTVSNVTRGIGNSWNNGARAFKGMFNGLGAGLGAAGEGAAGLVGSAYNAGARGLNTIGSRVSQLAGGTGLRRGQGIPLIPQHEIDTRYNVAGALGNVARGYGSDVMKSMGAGPQGLAGTLESGSAGDQAWRHMLHDPNITTGARNFSANALDTMDTAAHMAPVAAIGSLARGAHALSHGGGLGGYVGRVARPVLHTVEKLNEGHAAPLGVMGSLLYRATGGGSAGGH